MLTSQVPLYATPGTRIHVTWTLTSADGRPFGAGGVFVRLRSASGAKPEIGYAPTSSASGEYAATVVVPEGGIGDVEIGLRGWTSGPTGRHRSDLLFPIANRSLITHEGDDAPAPDTGMRTWPFLVGPGLLVVLAVALVLFRRRGGESASPWPV